MGLTCPSVCLTNQVQLTWDETDHDRVTALNRKFNKEELLDMDFNAYLASSSEEEEEEGEGGIDFGEEENGHEDNAAGGETVLRRCDVLFKEPSVEKKPQREEEKKKKKKSEEQISKYRELLKGIQDKEKKLQEDKDMEMEITWVPGKMRAL